MSQSTGVRCENPMCTLTFPTYGIMRSHLKQAASCKWWPSHAKEAAAKLAQPPAPTVVAGSIHDMTASFWDVGESYVVERGEDEDDDDEEDEDEEADEESGTGLEEGDEDSARYVDVGPSPELLRELMEMNDPEDFYDIVHPNVDIGEDGPGPSTLRARLNRMLSARRRYLDDGEEDSEDEGRVVDEHPKGGTVIRMARTLHERWAALFGTSHIPPTSDTKMDGSGQADLTDYNIYHPFASKLDWEIAQWMVKDGIGHSSFNRLLGIDRVRK